MTDLFGDKLAADTHEREILQRVFLPVGKAFQAKITRRVFFFLSPPFAEREKGYVLYYGLDEQDATPSAINWEERFSKIYKSLDFPADANGFDRFSRFMMELRKEYSGKRAELKEAAVSLLSRAPVRLGDVKITADGPIQEEKKVLLDHAFDLANQAGYPAGGVTRGFLQELMAREPYNRPDNQVRFVSNDHFAAGDQVECTLLVAADYLTRAGYIYESEGEAAPVGGTVFPFVAECLYFANGDIDALTGENVLRRLRQIHLPIAALGQYRASVCWISRVDRRGKEERRLLVIQLNSLFQQLLGEFTSLGLIEIFESKLMAALDYRYTRGEDQGYYQKLALAFGYLFWSYQIEFFNKGALKAKGVNGRVDMVEGNHPDGNSAPPPDTFLDLQDTPNGKGTIITINLRHVADDKRTCTEVIASLGFDSVVCSAFLVRDKERLKLSTRTIRGKIVDVVEEHQLSVSDRLQSIAFTFGHHLKNEYYERDSAHVAAQLEPYIRRKEAEVVVDRALLQQAVVSLQSEERSLGTAELFGAVAKVATGVLPHGWRAKDWSGEITEQVLRRWEGAFRTTIHNVSIYYTNDLLRRSPPYNLRIWERDHDDWCERVGLKRQPVGAIPPLATKTPGPPLAILAGLMELTRNGLKHIDDDFHTSTIQQHHGGLHLFYEITIDSSRKSVTATLWNTVSDKSEVEPSKSIYHLLKLTNAIQAIFIDDVKSTTSVPGWPRPSAAAFYAVAGFTVFPDKLVFEDSSHV